MSRNTEIRKFLTLYRIVQIQKSPVLCPILPDFQISGSELSGIVSKTSGFPNVNYPVQCQKLPDFGFEPSGIV